MDEMLKLLEMGGEIGVKMQSYGKPVLYVSVKKEGSEYCKGVIVKDLPRLLDLLQPNSDFWVASLKGLERCLSTKG